MKNNNKYSKTKYAYIYADKRWHNLRTYKSQKEPFCVKCLQNGFTTIATQLDHIIPLGYCPNPFDAQNTQRLCDKCHHSKTQKEKKEYNYPPIYTHY